MKWIKKCEYGHINSEKKKLLLGTLIMIAIGVAIFVLGLCLNKFDHKNIFTVVAVLFVLPMARYLCTLIILLPYQTPDKELYDLVKEYMPKGSTLFSDYVFTSGERAMGMSFFVLTEHEYIGLLASEKEKQTKIQDYLTDSLKKRGIPGKVVLCTNPEVYFTKLKKGQEVTKSEEERQELLDFLRSLAV